MTERKLFTLSAGTKNILSTLNEKIVFRVYFSKILGDLNPSHTAYFNRVKKLLERYEALSGGNVKLELFNPEPFSDTEDRAVSFGMQGVPLGNTGDLGYFGLVGLNTVDDMETIPYMSLERESFLEYDLTKIIHKLSVIKRPSIGLISSLPVNGQIASGMQSGGMQRWAVMDQIHDLFNVQTLELDASEIPKDVGTLLIIHPKNLSESLLYAIDQFILKGGSALVFVDSNAEIAMALNRGIPAAGISDFDRILNAWGVKLIKGKVLGDLEAARRVNVNIKGKVAVADYVVWLSLGARNLDGKDVTLAEIDHINVASSGILEPLSDSTTKFSPLIRTGLQAMRIDTEKIRNQPDVLGLYRDFKAENTLLTVAARITGTPSSAYTSAPGANTSAEQHKMIADKSINVVVVADTDMLHDQFWMQQRKLFDQSFSIPHAHNGAFVINILENLSGGAALIGLRGRGETRRPFQLVEEIRQKAERKYLAKEQELEKQLAGVQAKLNNLLEQKDVGSEATVTQEDRDAVNSFRRQMIAIRKELRSVQLALRQDIDKLDGLLKFFNIAAIPFLLAFAALMWAILRRVRRNRLATQGLV